MPTYKDVEPIIKELKDLRDALGDKALSVVTVSKRAAFKSAIAIINTAPAADVAPVVHGEWIYGYTPYGVRIHLCSVCREQASLSEIVGKELQYCPNCGARMDG